MKFVIKYAQEFAEVNNIILAACLDEFHVMIENIASRIALEEKLKLDEALKKRFGF